METEYTYCRRRTPVGVKVEEIAGAEQRSGAVWLALAMQVYRENGRDGEYRTVEHTESGAPLLEPENARISISHTGHLLVVATLPETPDVDLTRFNPATALGVDAEHRDRAQVLKVRERFLSEPERALIVDNDIEANIVAWTVKEAVYKAALTPGLDLRDIRISRMPSFRDGEPLGLATAVIPGFGHVEFQLYSYPVDDCIVTLALTADTVTFTTPRGITEK